MPITHNSHQQAVGGAELRGWEYRKFADVAAMNLVTGRPGEICTVTATGVDYQWNAVRGAWLPWVQGQVLRLATNASGTATNGGLVYASANATVVLPVAAHDQILWIFPPPGENWNSTNSPIIDSGTAALVGGGTYPGGGIVAAYSVTGDTWRLQSTMVPVSSPPTVDIALAYTAANNLTFATFTTTGGSWQIDWGDGAGFSTLASGATRNRAGASGTATIRTDSPLSLTQLTLTSDAAFFSSQGWTFDINVLAPFRSMVALVLSNTQVQGDVSSLNALTALVNFHVARTRVTYTTPGFNGSTALTSWKFGAKQNPGLTQTEVDLILAHAVATGRNNGVLETQAGTNAAPSAAGITNRTTLIGRGWTVTTN